MTTTTPIVIINLDVASFIGLFASFAVITLLWFAVFDDDDPDDEDDFWNPQGPT